MLFRKMIGVVTWGNGHQKTDERSEGERLYHTPPYGVLAPVPGGESVTTEKYAKIRHPTGRFIIQL